MKRNIFWTILFLLTGGCTNEMIETSHHTLHIKGNEIGYFNSHSHSRLSETNETLPTRSNITFYSQGGIHADELLFTYNGTAWEGDTDLKWEDAQQQAITMSYYPPLYVSYSMYPAN